MDEYYTKAELKDEIKKLKAKKDGYETKMNDWYTKINSYMSEISSIREKIKKIEDDECNNSIFFNIYCNFLINLYYIALDKTKCINEISRLNEENDEQKMLLECARDLYKSNRELFDATQNSINELKEKFQSRAFEHLLFILYHTIRSEMI